MSHLARGRPAHSTLCDAVQGAIPLVEPDGTVRVVDVRNGKEGEKGFWTRIGVAWLHKDGKGLDVQLDGLAPLDGRIVLREPSEEKA